MGCLALGTEPEPGRVSGVEPTRSESDSGRAYEKPMRPSMISSVLVLMLHLFGRDGGSAGGDRGTCRH